MATITLIATGTWDATNTSIWSPAQVPTASDDVIIASGFTASCATTGCVCRNITYSGGQTNNNNISVNGNVSTTASYSPKTSNVTTLTLSNPTATISCVDILPAGLIINASGVSVTSNLIISKLTINTGCRLNCGAYNLTTNLECIATGILSMSSGNILIINDKELALVDSILSSVCLMNGVNITFYILGSNLTFDCNIGNINLTSLSSVTDNSRRNLNIGANLSSINTIGTASLALNIYLKNNIVISGPINLHSSDLDRIYIRSSYAGTKRSITCNGYLNISNIVFSDINGRGSASWDLSSSIDVGDGGNNSGIIFSAGVNKFWVAASGGRWNDKSSWSLTSGGLSGADVPLPQDVEIYDSKSITSTGRSITFNATNPFHGKIDSSLLPYSPILVTSYSQTFCEDLDLSGFGSITHNSSVITLRKLLKDNMFLKVNNNLLFYNIITVNSPTLNNIIVLQSNLYISNELYCPGLLNIDIQSFYLKTKALYYLRSVIGNGTIEVNYYMFHTNQNFINNNIEWSLKLSGIDIVVECASSIASPINIFGNLIVDCSSSCIFRNLNTALQVNKFAFNNIIFLQPGKPFIFYGESGQDGSLRISAETVTNNAPVSNPISITANNGQGIFDIGDTNRSKSFILDFGYANFTNIKCPSLNTIYTKGIITNCTNVYNQLPKMVGLLFYDIPRAFISYINDLIFNQNS